MRSSSKLTSEEFKIVFIISIVGICAMLGTDIHLASLPAIMRYLHTDKTHMQQSVSIFLLGIGVSLLFYGPLSDKYGRRPVVIIGLCIAVLASFAAIFATQINFFLLTRLLQGMGSGVCLGLGRIIIADILQDDRFATAGSYFIMFLSLSPLLAPAIGGYIQHWFGWQANFIVLGLVLAIALLLYAIFCPETNHFKNDRAILPQELWRNYKALFTHPIFVAATLLSGIGAASAMSYATTSAFIFQIQFHLSPITYGWLTAIVGVGSFLGRFINPILIVRVGSKQTLFIGLLLLIFSGLWLMFCILVLQNITVILIMTAMLFMILGQSFIMPTAAAKALSPFHDKRGSAGALYGSFQVLIAFLCSAIVGTVAHNGVIVLAVAYCMLGLLGIGIFFGRLA